jgi:hypothetical protein
MFRGDPSPLHRSPYFSVGQTGPDPRGSQFLAELTPRIAGNGFIGRERFGRGALVFMAKHK